MGDALVDKFVSMTTPDVIERVREEAARVCEETARAERGERAMMIHQANPLLAEFSDEAYGVASEVAMTVLDSVKRTGSRLRPADGWTLAARLLRNGWKRGDRLVGHVVGEKPAS